MKTEESRVILGSYHPTLWRTSRVLANDKRLRCLREVIRSPGECVEEIADAVGISEASASIQLRLLQSRGLITAYRESRWVRYYPEADAKVPSSEPILQAFCAVFASKSKIADVMKQITAYTHTRRLRILKLMQYKSPIDKDTLAYKCNMSIPAANRHIAKLVKRGLLKLDDDGVSLIPPNLPIHQTMLELITKGL